MSDQLTKLKAIMERGVEERVIDKMRERREAGRMEHGHTMERTDLTRRQWLENLQEELTDAAVYAQKLIDMEE